MTPLAVRLMEMVHRHISNKFTQAQKEEVVKFLIQNGDLIVVTLAKEFSYKIVNTMAERTK
jgi:hypothetical protein